MREMSRKRTGRIHRVGINWLIETNASCVEIIQKIIIRRPRRLIKRGDVTFKKPYTVRYHLKILSIFGATTTPMPTVNSSLALQGSNRDLELTIFSQFGQYRIDYKARLGDC